MELFSEIGLNGKQIVIYSYLLENNRATIQEMQGKVNYSYAVILKNLKILEARGLISKERGKKPIVFFKNDILSSISRIIVSKFDRLSDSLKNLNEEVIRHQSSMGVCLKEIPFYHFSDLHQGFNHLHDLINNATMEIYLSSLPPHLLKNLEISLNSAYKRGVHISMYYSPRDFDEINYLVTITDLLKKVGMNLVETKEKICQLIRFNDVTANSGVILVDSKYLNTIIFKDEEIYHFDGFYSPHFVNQIKDMWKIKTVIKRLELTYPTPHQRVLDTIKSKGNLKTRNISEYTGISGSRLRGILDFLVEKGAIQEETITGEQAGRPMKVYAVIEEEVG
ncbi:MAG: helix-turn-helix domain-containing protein [Promethearchaeota archaeon]